jgi:hypothetical protein
MTGPLNHFFGMKHSVEYKVTRSKLYKGKTYEELLGKEKADAKKAKQSKTQSALHIDPDYKKAQSERMTIWWAERKKKVKEQ